MKIKRLFKKLTLFVLSLCVMSTVLVGITLPVGAVTSGTTGQCKWVLNGTVLTIRGEGAMADYNIHPRPPWGTAITSVILEDGVTNVGKYAFYDCKELTGISIPNTVTRIGAYAFLNCDDLENVAIPDTVRIIGAYAFADCSSITSIAIPNSVTTIAEDAFYNCTGLTSIVIPDSVTSLGRFVFSNCSNLKTISIGSGVTTIPDYAFRYCRSLKSIDIPSNIIRIGDGVFYGCTGLTSIDIPDNVKRVDAGVFYGCTNLTSASIGSGVRSVSFQMFYKCENLKDISIGDGVASISGFAFSKCKSLEKVTIPNKVLTISSNAFSDCTALKSVTIPNRVKGIGDYVFFNCKSLESAVLGNGVKSIGAHTFEHCEKLVSITIPKSVGEIGKSAFLGCTSLEQKGKVYYCGSNLQWKQISIKAENSELEGASIYNHKYSWVVDKEPTCADTGTKHEQCILCSATRSIGTVIPATKKHTYKDTVVRPTATTEGYTIHSCKVCGDKYRDNFTHNVDGVKNMFVDVSDTSLVVTWDAYSDAAKYNVYVTDSKGNFVVTKALDGYKNSVTLSWPSDIEKNKTYTIGVQVKTTKWLGTVYRDKALKVVGNTASGSADLGTPTINADEVSAAAVKLSFSEVKGADKYIVYLKSANGAETVIKETAKTKITVTGLKPNTAYEVKLQAKMLGMGYSKKSGALATVTTAK